MNKAAAVLQKAVTDDVGHAALVEAYVHEPSAGAVLAGDLEIEQVPAFVDPCYDAGVPAFTPSSGTSSGTAKMPCSLNSPGTSMKGLPGDAVLFWPRLVGFPDLNTTTYYPRAARDGLFCCA